MGYVESFTIKVLNSHLLSLCIFNLGGISRVFKFYLPRYGKPFYTKGRVGFVNILSNPTKC